MPCYEGPRPEDVERGRLMAGAHPALLCGLMRGQELEKTVAEAWCLVHAAVDAARPYSERAGTLQKLCDDILIDYNLKRGAVERCKHPNFDDFGGRGGYCPNCGFDRRQLNPSP